MNGYDITGFEQVQKAFSVLGDKAARRVVKSAGRAGAAQIRKAVRAAAPKSNVNRKNITVKVSGGHKYDYLKKHLRQQIKATVVKSREAEVKTLVHTSDAFWGRFTEKGTKLGIDAQHWMEKAFDRVEDAVKAGIEAKIVQAIMREADKGVR